MKIEEIYPKKTKINAEERLELSELVCSDLEKHTYQADPALWKTIIANLKKWSAMRKDSGEY